MSLPVEINSEAVAVAKRENKAELEHLVNSTMTLGQIERGLADVRRMDTISRAKCNLMEGCLLGIAKRDHFEDRPASEFYAWAEEQTGLRAAAVKERVLTADRVVGLSPSRITDKAIAGNRPNGKPSSYSSLARPSAIPGRRREYVDDIDPILAKTRIAKLRDAALDAAREENEIAKLAKQIVDIGFKALATKLHPDKGGNRTAMVRLNAAKKMLLGACNL